MSALSIPSYDAAEFAALPLDVRNEIRRWMRLMTPVFHPPQGCRCKIGDAMRRIALDMGCSEVTARRKYDGLRQGNWRCLINRSKTPAAQAGVPREIIEEFKRRCERNQRKSKPAWRRMILDDLPSGKLAHLPWPPAGPGGIPEGCSYRNLMNELDKFELEAIRQGQGEAWADHGSQFLGTRVGLYVGAFVIPDDVKRDLVVALLGNVGKRANIQELGILDLFSGDRYMTHRRPQFERADGTKDSLKEREMRFLFAANFRNVGYHPVKGTCVLAELGTAALRKPLAQWLHEHSNGKISTRPPGMRGKEQAVAGYYGRGGGNPRHKAALESHHNLLHNEAGDLPAPTGHDRHPPEWLHGVEAVTDQVLGWMLELPPERGALLRLPVLEYWQACQLLADIDLRIAWRTDHQLEGWERLGFTTIEFRASVIEDRWLSPDEFLSLSHSEQSALSKAATLLPSLQRPRKLAPREVFAAGARELRTIPDHEIALMFCDRNLGDDLRVTKSLGSVAGDNAFEFSDKYAEPDRMFFDGHRVTRPDGGELRLEQRVKYGCVLNPFDRERLWVFDHRGGYIGAAPRIQRVCQLDDRATEIRLGQIEHDKAVMLAPLKERHADAAEQIAELQEHNRRVVEGEPVTPEAITQARRESRLEAKAAAAGAALRQSTPSIVSTPSTDEEIEIRHI